MKFSDTSPATREQLVGLLTENQCVVTFTKVDGETREMPCTLRPDLLPAVVVVEGAEKKERKRNDSVLSVWCTDKESWRSFRVDSVQSIEVQ